MKYFVCKIHNNCLGQSFEIDSWDEGVKKIISLANSDGYTLQDEDIEILENDGEYYNDDLSYSIGVLESNK